VRQFAVFLIFVLGLLGVSQTASAARIDIDLSSQTMRVASGAGDYIWPISSARAGYVTPRGSYRVQRMEVMHRSHKYYNSPMPHSIFFRGGYAIHGSYETASLGSPSSHGCIRLSPANAAMLYRIVQAEGARIVITGSRPVSDTRYARAELRRHRHEQLIARQDAAQRALGYAPTYETPSLEDWMRAPTGHSRPAAVNDDD
jgi:hypothetical protein